jgi:6-phosphogluconolactonase
MVASSRSRSARLLWLAAVCVGVMAAFGAAPAWAGHDDQGHSKAKAKHPKAGSGKKAGAAYTQTNDPAGNQVVVYRRASNGQLTELKRVATGGVGAASTPPFGFPIVDSQGSLELTKNGRLLFAVNAGDDTISSFRVKKNGSLKLVDRTSSGGDMPVSLDSSRKLLYVVNSLSGDISGLRFTRKGGMTPIAGSTESLAPAGGQGAPAQLGFSPRGRVVTVTLRGHTAIDTFKIGRDGTPGPAKVNASNQPSPFGFEYQNSRNLIVSNAGETGNPPDPTNPANFHGSASSYLLDSASGTLTPNGAPVPIPGQRATCWVVITKNHKYAFMTNTLSETVSRFRLSNDGDLTLLGNTPTGPGFASDEALSRNSRYLYVLVPSIIRPDAQSHIDQYRVGSGGSLTHIGTTTSNLPPGVSGMAAR